MREDVSSRHQPARSKALAETSGAILIAAGLFVYFVGALVRRVGRVAPIDDAYIHYQYAWNLARGYLFRFHPGDDYSTGETSPLYAALLALGALCRIDRTELVVGSQLIGGAALSGTLLASARMVARATSSRAAVPFSMGALAVHGFLSWTFFSGMETGVYITGLALLLLTLQGWQAPDDPPRALLFLAAMLPLARPEGAVATTIVVFLVVSRRNEQGGARTVLLRVACVSAPFAAYLATNRILTGQFATAGLEMKSLLFMPYLNVTTAAERLLDNAANAVQDFLLGRKPDFAHWWELPLGISGWVAVCVGELRSRRAGVGSVGLALFVASILAGAEVGIPQWRGERYQAPSFFLLVVGVCLAAGLASTKLPHLRVELWLAIAFGFAVLPSVPNWRETFVRDADTIRSKQVSAALAVRDDLPRDARVLVCDAGALGFLSEHWTYDVVGLTTPMRRNSYVAGPGSRFEELERTPRDRWPDYAAVYFWCMWDGIEGRTLSEHLDMRLQEFHDPGLGTGEAPVLRHDGVIVDTLDVADLDSEERHGWIESDGGARDRNHVGRASYEGRIGTVADGGRSILGSVAFTLRARRRTRATLVLRVALPAPLSVQVSIDERAPRTLQTAAGENSGWLEPELDLGRLEDDRMRIRIDVPKGERLALYHLWLFQDAE